MGKGQRARENRELSANDALKKKVTNKKGEKKWVTPLVTTVIVVCLVALLILTVLDGTGIALRARTVLETENYKINGTMMKFATMSTYNNMISQWGQEIAQYLQFDDIKESAKESVKQSLVYAEAAKAAGIELDEDEKANIEESLNEMSEAAKTAGYTEKAYLAMMFGKGVNKDDIRDFYLITTLAGKYQNQLYDEAVDAVTDEEIDAYYKDNLATLAVADVVKYSETLTFEEGLSDDEKAAKKAEFLAKFDAMGAAADEAAFNEALLAYLTEKNGVEEKEGTLTNEEQVENAKVTAHKSEIKLAATADWLFETDDDKNLVREAGEVKVFTSDDKSADATEESSSTTAAKDFTVEVCFIVKAPYADESITKSTGHILMAFDSYETKEEAKAKAEEVYAEFLAGEQSKDRFEELAEEYTDDSGVFYDDITEGQMVEPFENWVFDDARQFGDTGIVETEYGYHIMYFTGEATWLYTSRTAVVSEKTGDRYEEFEKAYSVEVNESALAAVKQ